MDNQTLFHDTENKIYVDTTVKIGDYNMKFKATGYKSDDKSLFSVSIYDKLYELTGTTNETTGLEWHFTDENLLPEDLATVIGKEIEKQTAG